MFMLIIWLQGIWLPLHGYTFEVTPLWAGIFMIPLTAGFIIAGPLSGVLSDRYGPRPFATFGMLGTAVCFFLLETLPVNFSYGKFAVLLFVTGVCMSAVRRVQPDRGHEQPPGDRPGRRFGDEHDLPELGPGALHRHLLHADHRRALRHPPRRPGARSERPRCAARDGGVDLASPARLDVVRRLLGLQPGQPPPGAHVLSQLTPGQRATVTGERFFPRLITDAFRNGLHAAFNFGIVMCLVGAAASWTRGGKAPAAAVEAEDALELSADPEPATL